MKRNAHPSDSIGHASRHSVHRRKVQAAVIPCALLLSLTLISGCNYVVLAGLLISGPPSIEPDFDAVTNQSMTDHGVTVAVVCYAPTELKWDFPSLDKQVAQYVSFRMRDKKIKVIHPDHVQNWLDRNPDWDKPEEIGAHFEATYVVYIDMHKYSLFEENSSNLYRGRCEALVSVVEMDGSGEGDKIYSKEIISRFPLHAPRQLSEVSYGMFERQFLGRLSEEIGRLFYEHYAGDDMPDAA